MDSYIKTHLETETMTYLQGAIELKIGLRKPLKITINIRLTGTLFIDVNFKIFTYDVIGRSFKIKFEKSDGKKQYDRTYVFSIDLSKIKYYNYLQVTKARGGKHITLIYLTVEFEENFQSID